MNNIDEIVGKKCTYIGTYYDNDFNEKECKVECVVIGFTSRIEEGLGSLTITANLRPSTNEETIRVNLLSDDDEICSNLYEGVDINDILF